jgi:uncharacterized membrane protein (DUF4010 family)
VDSHFDLELAFRLAVAVGLGLLMGLEREWSNREEVTSFGGVRTFPLIALSGAASVYAGHALSLPVLPIAAFAGIAVLVAVSYHASTAQGQFGMTTEVSALLSFVIGALCGEGQLSVAVAIGVVAMLLLALKDSLHSLVTRIEARDIEATLRFALISAIVLPLLPDRDFGPPPFDVLNPFEIWLMVVLIAGLDFAGYLLVKALGAEHGFGLTGLLGGLVSSTALTLGFARRSQDQPAQCNALALGILVAWTVMFVRVVGEVAVVEASLVPRVLPMLAALGVVGLAATAVLHRMRRAAKPATAALDTAKNPLELGSAVRFGLLYALITLGAKAAQEYAGDAGLYAAGALAGMTDVDAITLSMANLVRSNPESAAVAARTIAIAVLSNTAVKCGMVFALGSAPLRRAMLPVAGALAAAGAAGLVLGAVLDRS